MSDSDGTTSVDTSATERALDVDDVSPPESPPINHDPGGPEPYRLEPSVQPRSDCRDDRRRLPTLRRFVAEAIDLMVIAGFEAIEGSPACIFATK